MMESTNNATEAPLPGSTTSAATSTTTKSKKQADRTTMEGMIWNANHVLEQALDPKEKSLPKQLFDKCVAVVLISVVEGGFVVTGNVGTGIILKKTTSTTNTASTTSSSSSTNGWSAPIACGLVGLGYGFMAGLSLKDILVFVMDEYTLDSMLSTRGFKLGGQAELTFGTLGRMAKLDFNASKKGFGSTVSFAFSKGLFGGISFEGAVVGIRKECNDKFYSNNTRKVSAEQILSGEIALPTDKDTTLLQEVYNKLNLLSKKSTVGGSGVVANEEADIAVEADVVVVEK